MPTNRHYKYQKDKEALLAKLTQEIAAGLLSGKTNTVDSPIEQREKLGKLDIDDRLFLAILLNSKEIVNELLDLGADPNATNNKGTTLLQLALALGREDVAHLLLDSGAVIH